MALFVRNPSPTLALLNHRHGALTDTMSLRDFLVRSIVGTYSLNRLKAQFVILATPRHLIQHIVIMSAWTQMRGIDAAPIVARVENKETYGDRPNQKHIGGAVCFYFAEIAIAFISASSPFPASSFGFRGITPEADGKWLSISAFIGARRRAEFTVSFFDLLPGCLKGLLAGLTCAWYGWFNHIRNLSFLCWSGPQEYLRYSRGSFYFSTPSWGLGVDYR